MNFYAANLEVLRERFPVCARRVELVSGGHAGPGQSVTPSSDGLVRRWLGGRTWAGGTIVAVSGFGEGAHIQALLDTLSADSWVFVAQQDTAQFRRVLARADWTGLFRDPRFLLGVGETDDAFFQVFESIEILNVRDVDPLIFAPEYNRSPKYYARFFTEFVRQMEFRRKLHGTAMVDAALWQANTFANLRAVGCAPDVAALRGLFTGMPMVLVSAGPSLDRSLDFLRGISKRVLTVAVNSSYRALRNAGIVPHLVLAADPRGFTRRGFENVAVDRTWLVTTPIVDPQVPALFGDRLFSWSGNNLLVSEIRRRAGLPAGSTLIEQGTVSACAVDLAVLMGCDRICLVAQDLAVRSDGQSHATDSFYTDLNSNRSDLRRCRMLPGNILPEVPVDENLHVYLKTFAQLAANRPQLRWLNTASLGAKIPGVPYGTFREAVDWLGNDVAGSPFEILERAHRQGREHALAFSEVREVLRPTASFASDLLRRSLQAVRLLEGVLSGACASAGSQAVSVEAGLAAVDELRSKADSQPDDLRILRDGKLGLELYRMIAANRDAVSEDPLAKRTREAAAYAWATAESAWFLGAHVSAIAADGAR